MESYEEEGVVLQRLVFLGVSEVENYFLVKVALARYEDGRQNFLFTWDEWENARKEALTLGGENEIEKVRKQVDAYCNKVGLKSRIEKAAPPAKAKTPNFTLDQLTQLLKL